MAIHSRYPMGLTAFLETNGRSAADAQASQLSLLQQDCQFIVTPKIPAIKVPFSACPVYRYEFLADLACCARTAPMSMLPVVRLAPALLFAHLPMYFEAGVV